MKKTIEQLAIDFVKAHTTAEEDRIYAEMREMCACDEEVQCFIDEAYENC